MVRLVWTFRKPIGIERLERLMEGSSRPSNFPMLSSLVHSSNLQVASRLWLLEQILEIRRRTLMIDSLKTDLVGRTSSTNLVLRSMEIKLNLWRSLGVKKSPSSSMWLQSEDSLTRTTKASSSLPSSTKVKVSKLLHSQVINLEAKSQVITKKLKTSRSSMELTSLSWKRPMSMEIMPIKLGNTSENSRILVVPTFHGTLPSSLSTRTVTLLLTMVLRELQILWRMILIPSSPNPEQPA